MAGKKNDDAKEPETKDAPKAAEQPKETKSEAKEQPKTESRKSQKKIPAFASPNERDDLPEGIYGGAATIDNPPKA